MMAFRGARKLSFQNTEQLGWAHGGSSSSRGFNVEGPETQVTRDGREYNSIGKRVGFGADVHKAMPGRGAARAEPSPRSPCHT
ncbi:hypothetical protein THIOKS11770019 [Thiocapsa sp. KS1]|nr:hypothetical protein THIOKS11770019 [Thiocapsa sp. KS1]